MLAMKKAEQGSKGINRSSATFSPMPRARDLRTWVFFILGAG